MEEELLRGLQASKTSKMACRLSQIMDLSLQIVLARITHGVRLLLEGLKINNSRGPVGVRQIIVKGHSKTLWTKKRDLLLKGGSCQLSWEDTEWYLMRKMMSHKYHFIFTSARS